MNLKEMNLIHREKILSVLLTIYYSKNDWNSSNSSPLWSNFSSMVRAADRPASQLVMVISLASWWCFNTSPDSSQSFIIPRRKKEIIICFVEVVRVVSSACSTKIKNTLSPCLFQGKWIPGIHFPYFPMFGNIREK